MGTLESNINHTLGAAEVSTISRCDSIATVAPSFLERGDMLVANKECPICGEVMVTEMDVGHDEDSRSGFRVDYYSRCQNLCLNCGEHRMENGNCICEEVSDE